MHMVVWDYNSLSHIGSPMSAPCMGKATHFTRKRQLSAVPTDSDYPFGIFKLFLKGLVAGGKSY